MKADNIKILLYVFLAAFVIIMSYFGGYVHCLNSGAQEIQAREVIVPEPYPVYYENTTIEYVEKPVVVYEEVEKIVEVEVPVEVEKWVNPEWQQWESSAQFLSWANDHLTTLCPAPGQEIDCDDYAEYLQLEAYKDGYLLSQCVVDASGRILGKHCTDVRELHAACLVQIKNAYYFYEPQPEIRRLVFLCNRD